MAQQTRKLRRRWRESRLFSDPVLDPSSDPSVRPLPNPLGKAWLGLGLVLSGAGVMLGMVLTGHDNPYPIVCATLAGLIGYLNLVVALGICCDGGNGGRG